MNKIVMEIELKGTALLEASETLLKMAQAIDARLVPAAPEAPIAPAAGAPSPTPPKPPLTWPSVEEVPSLAPPEAPAPPAPEAPAPPAPEAPAPPAPAIDGAEVDSEGIPWDGRIHSAGKSRVKSSNTWKLKRGVDKALVDQVKAEYLAAPIIPAAETAEPAAPPVAPVAPPVPPVAPPVAPVAPPVAPVAPPVAPVAPPAVEDQTPAGYKMTEAADGIPYESYIDEGWTKEQLIETGIMVAVEATPDESVTYESIVDKITQKINSAESIKPGEIEGILASLGDPSVNSLPSLSKRPELWAAVYAKLVEAWG